MAPAGTSLSSPSNGSASTAQRATTTSPCSPRRRASTSRCTADWQRHHRRGRRRAGRRGRRPYRPQRPDHALGRVHARNLGRPPRRRDRRRGGRRRRARDRDHPERWPDRRDGVRRHRHVHHRADPRTDHDVRVTVLTAELTPDQLDGRERTSRSARRLTWLSAVEILFTPATGRPTHGARPRPARRRRRERADDRDSALVHGEISGTVGSAAAGTLTAAGAFAGHASPAPTS